MLQAPKDMDTDSVAEPVKDSKTAPKPASRRPSGVLPEVEVLAQLVVIIFLIDQKLLEEVSDPASLDHHLKCMHRHAACVSCPYSLALKRIHAISYSHEVTTSPTVSLHLTPVSTDLTFFLWLIVRNDSFTL